MKKYIYIYGILTFALFSCTVDELDNELQFDTDELKYSETTAKSTDSDPLTKSIEGACFEAPLLDYNDFQVGSLYFTIKDQIVDITFQTRADWKLLEANLSISECENKEFPINDYGELAMSDFQYSTDDKDGSLSLTISVNKSDIQPYTCYAAQAAVMGPKGRIHNVWANEWEQYIKTYLGDCDIWSDNNLDYDYCNDNESKVYICHNGNTICVSVNAVQAHLDHGDQLGQCD